AGIPVAVTICDLSGKEKVMKTRHVILSIALGGMLVSGPATIPSTLAADNRSSDPSIYSDRDRAKSSKDETDKLQKSLKTGEEKTFYRRELEKMGWQITAVNYDKPDYLEYEIVKGKSSYEVQIDFDGNSHKATKVDVTTNAWKADSTKRALEGKSVNFQTKTTANPSRFSDRDRMKSTKGQKEKLEQALKTGEEKDFYRRQLEKMGWKVTSVNYDKPDYVEYEIVKGDDSYEVQVDIDKNSHKA